MRILWRLGRGSVEDVRAELPRRRRGAYTTVQTVLNRLVERGLLSRERLGAAFTYAPRVSEAEYLSSSLQEELANASPQAREAAIATLVGGLDEGEIEALRVQAAKVDERRRGRRS